MSFTRKLKRKNYKKNLENAVINLYQKEKKLSTEHMDMAKYMGGIIQKYGNGELRIPVTFMEEIKDKNLKSKFDQETNEYVFYLEG